MAAILAYTSRSCAYCGADISHRQRSARTCDDACRQSFHRHGPRKSTSSLESTADGSPVRSWTMVERLHATRAFWDDTFHLPRLSEDARRRLDAEIQRARARALGVA